MVRGTLKMLVVFFLALFSLAGCGGGGGGSGGDGAAADGGGDGLVVPARTVAPGEIFTVSHRSIRAGVPAEVVLDLGGDPVTIAYTAEEDGILRIALPPVIDPVTGELGGGTIVVSLAGEGGFAEVEVGALPDLGADLMPGEATLLVIDAVLENYAAALEKSREIEAESGGAVDITEVEASIAESVARLEEMRDEIAQTGELTVLMSDGSAITLGGEDLKTFDRWLIASVEGIYTASEASVVAPRSAARATATEADIRALIAGQQVVAGLNTRAREIDEATVNVFVALGGVPANIVGRFGNAFGAMVATGELVVALRGSQLSLALTVASLNGEAQRQEEWNSLLVNLGGFGLGLVAVAGAAVTAPAWLSLVGTYATMAGLAMAMGGMSEAVTYSTELKVDIPARGVEFSELRVVRPETYAFPSIGVVLVDAEEVSNIYDLHVYGVQGAGDGAAWSPDAWTVLSINRAYYAVRYGNPAVGEVNTARGGGGVPPAPAVSVEEFRQFGVVATALHYRSVENAEPIRTRRGSVDIKYVDGPVVFTFEIRDHPELPEPRTDIAGHISNGSSLPLSIQRLEFEIEPGRTAPVFRYSGPTPLITVPPGGDERFLLTDVTIEAGPSLTGVPRHPRLLVDNAGASPAVQRFWDGLRSAPALTGLFTVAAPPPVDAIVSTFDDEFSDRWGIGSQAPGYGTGWFQPEDVADYRRSGGNPDAYLSWRGDQGDWWFFVTYSDKYRGDRSFAYGRDLSFDLRTEYGWPNQDFFIPFVLLGGTDAAGEPLYLYQAQSEHPEPGTDWTHYVIPLHESSAWRISSASGLSPSRDATGEDIRQVLSTLTSLRIRGEYGGYRYRGDLDNVILGAQ